MAVILITGATRGIGQAAAVELAGKGHKVAIVGRDHERVKETAEKGGDAARASGSGGLVHQHVADLASMDEVRRLAAEVLEAYPRLDVLANNAGALFGSRKETPDGFERTFALNHLAPFLLTSLLLERLAADGGGRVVTTASDAHTAGTVDLDDLQTERRAYRAMGVYGATKCENILFTRELAKRAPAGVTATCFHPGVVRTGFGNDSVIWRILTTVGAPFMRSPKKGASSLVWLAASDEAADLTGVYIVDEKVRQPSAQAQDDNLAALLWERSEELVQARARLS
jgi:NAD(P)-dependent dehydrogenase (short-subunit alcohol dehydrogenase family)